MVHNFQTKGDPKQLPKKTKEQIYLNIQINAAFCWESINPYEILRNIAKSSFWLQWLPEFVQDS